MTSDNQRNKAEKAKQVPEAGSGRGGLSGGAESGHTGAGIAGSDVSVGGSDGNLVGGPEGGESDMPASPREKASEGSKNNRR